LEFEYGSNLDEAANDIRNALELVKGNLPDDADEPVIFKFSTNMMPIVMLGITADESYTGLNKLVEDKIANQLKRLPGVGTVQTIGGPVRQIAVDIDPDKLEAFNLNASRIGNVLAGENLNMPAGSIKMGKIEYNVRTVGEFKSAKEMEMVVVGQQGGRIVYLKDVATIRDTLEEITRDVRFMGGKRGLMLMIQKQSGANTVDVAREVLAKIETIKKELPTDVNINKIMDSSEYIVDSISNLSKTILYAFIFISIVIIVFLRKWRAALIVLLTIPVSLIGAFIYLYFFGKTINIISLSSLAIAIGMVVDDAIVIIENITSHIERGARPREAAIFGSTEVGLAVMASTLTIVAVFFPLVFITGLSGILFSQLGFMVTITILISLFAALSIVPMLSARLLKSRKDENPIKNKTLKAVDRLLGNGLDSLDNLYQKVLIWGLGHKKTTIVVAAAIFAGSLALIPIVGTEFMPKSDAASLNISMELQSGTRLEETSALIAKVEDIIKRDFPEVIYYSGSAGTSSKGFSTILIGQSEGSNIASIRVRTSKKDERERSIFEMSDSLRDKISVIPGIKSLTISTSAGAAMLGGAPIAIDVIGADLDETGRIANQIKEFMSNLKGTRDVKLNVTDPKPELQVTLNREKLALNGLNTAMVANTVRSNIYGLTASKYRELGDEYDIFLRYPPNKRTSIGQIENLPISTPMGGIIKLKDVGRVVEKYSPSEVKRKNQERVISVVSDIQGRPLGDVTADIQNYVIKMHIPSSVSIEYGGQIEQQRDSFKDLGLLLLLSIVLVYMVMAAQFESFLDPFIVMFSLPFAFTGVILALLVTGFPINIMSLLGVVMLVGIVTKNAIVLVDFINITRARNIPLYEAIIYSGRSRLRPVLMTTLTTLLGTLPLALSRGQGSEMWQPLGIATVGGLFFSSIITLVLVPVLYSVFETRIKQKKEID
jgi:HAE1 family hydrophobic/amphiphilic exporter-1